MNTPWQYDETQQVGTDYRDQREVQAYDERMHKLRDVESEAKDIRNALRLSSESVVWEIGTGTGECALTLAVTVKHVHASDVSPAMLEYARHKAAQRVVGNVTFEAGGFLSGFRPAQPVDAVVTQLALHHLPDYWKSRALSVIADNLCPTGRLYLRDVVFPSTPVDYDAFFARAIDDIRSHAGTEMAEQLVRHIRTEFSTLDWILEGLMMRSQLTIIEKHVDGLLSVYVCKKAG